MHKVSAKGILSPSGGLNIYRGCTHGCIYCDSRSLCYGMTHPFEDVEVKENAVELLADALSRKRKKCMIGTGAMSDPYMPAELELGFMRRIAELVYLRGFGLTVLTKSDSILRDIDLLKKINDKTKCVVQMTLTTADDVLCKKIEPNVCPTSRRVEVLNIMRDNGIPTIVWLCPILPFINDTEDNIRELLDICVQAKVKGIMCFGMGLTLRDGNREYFYANLDRLFPGLKTKYIKTYGDSYVVTSNKNDYLMRIFHEVCERAGIMHNNDEIFAYLHEFPNEKSEQLTLF